MSAHQPSLSELKQEDLDNEYFDLDFDNLFYQPIMTLIFSNGQSAHVIVAESNQCADCIIRKMKNNGFTLIR